jgi:short-subunit dehydrogenase
MEARRAVTLITGASAGIGAALARVFASHGHELVLVARRADRLEALAAEIAATGQRPPLVLSVDLGDRAAVEQIGGALSQHGLEPEIVVNNAGFGLMGEAALLDRAEQLAMIDLNVRALTDLSLAFLDSIERRKGGILNVASIAGFLPGPGMAVYYATKAYVVSFSQALHYELKGKGVRVTALCPGPVPTEFQARAGMGSNSFPRIFERSPGRVADEGYRGLKEGRAVVIPGGHNKVAALLSRFAPRRLLLAATARHQASRRR